MSKINFWPKSSCTHCLKDVRLVFPSAYFEGSNDLLVFNVNDFVSVPFTIEFSDATYKLISLEGDLVTYLSTL